MNGSLQTPSSRNSPTRSKTEVLFAALTTLVLLTTAVCAFAQAAPDALSPLASDSKKIVRRWALPGDPRGVAVGSDGTIYVGVAEPQTVLAIDPKSGAIKKRLVLDSTDIASTKELVTMRTNAERTRLYIANGSDESATILRLPDLAVMREITMEGETIRDVIPDPRGRYLYILGRRVHIFDIDGDTELRTLGIAEPMAIAASANGSLLAVIAPENFGNTKATVVALFNPTTFAEITREPLQTEETIEAAMFAAGDRSLIAISRGSLFEKRVTSRATKAPVQLGLVNSTHVCLPERSGPQIATLTSTDAMLVYAERRCSASGTFSGTNSSVSPASLYGVNAYAVAYDKVSNTVVVTDRDGFLTIYSMPRPVVTSH